MLYIPKTQIIYMQYFDIISTIIKKPTKFFSKMPKTGYKEPIMFYAINVLIGAALTSLFIQYMPHSWMQGYAHDAMNNFSMMILSGAITLFAWPAIALLGLKIVKGKGNYKDTLRVKAYTSFVNLVSWIPIIGWIAGVYGMVINIIGLSTIHKISVLRTIGGILLALVIIFGAIMTIAGVVGIGVGTYLAMTNSTLLYPTP